MADATDGKKKIGGNEALLEAFNLGLDRVYFELEKRLDANVTKHFWGKSLGEFEDNATRQRATELLADIHKLRRTGVDVHHSGSIDSAVRIYLPDNGRDGTSDDSDGD